MKPAALLRLASVIALRRIISTWQLELAIAFGMVLAVALMVGGVIYSTFLEEAALQRNLKDQPLRELNLKLRTFYPLSREAHEDSLRYAEERVLRRMAPYSRGWSALVQTSTFYFVDESSRAKRDNTRPRGKLQHMTGFTDHVQLVAGRYPQSGGEPLEVAFDDTGAELLHVSVGNVLTLVPAVATPNPRESQVRVVGIYHVTDPEEEFWLGATEVFGYQGSTWAWAPMLTTFENIFGPVADMYPGLLTDESWVIYLNGPGLRANKAGILRDLVRSIRADVAANFRNGSVTTGLAEVLDQYREQVVLARVPLFLLVFLGISILLYYLFLLSTLVVRSRGEEIALLKSRGATTRQVGFLMLIEALLLAVPAVALGPFLSLLIVTTLGRALEISSATVSAVPIALSGRAFLLGAGGGLLCVLTVGLSALLVARQGIVQFRQAGARPPSTPFLHKYYVDLLLLAAVGLLWWQVLEKGSFLVRSVGQGELKLDFSLLLGPVFALLAIGLLLLRLFPWFLRLLARGAGALGPMWLVHGLKRLSRDPIMPGAMVVLLMLATALGLVGGAFNATIEQSQRDRALYQAGADVRVSLSSNAPSRLFFRPDAGLMMFAGENTASLALREQGWLTTSAFGSSVGVLAVDTEDFSSAAWLRSDFSDPSPDAMLERLAYQVPQQRGIIVPADASTLGVWVRPSRPDPSLQLRARIEDAQRQFYDLPLGTLGFQDWRLLETDVTRSIPLADPRGLTYRGRPPLVLHSLYVARQGNWRTGALFLDQVVVSTSSGRVALADFGTPDAWHATDTAGAPGLVALEPSLSVTREGRSSGVLTWADRGSGLRGAQPYQQEPAIPVLVSPSVLDEAHARVGDEVAIRISDVSVPVRIAGVVSYFPTLYEKDAPFLIIGFGPLADYFNARTARPPLSANEMWVRLTMPGATATDITVPLKTSGAGYEKVTLASEVVASRLSHPLLAAGWSGLLILTFFIVVLASASGLMLYSYLDAREREREFAMLRTLGLSRRQLNGVVWLSVTLILVCGIVLGTWAGRQLGTSLLPLLEVAEGGTRVTPPMVLHTNWTAILWYYLVLAAAAAATALALAWLLGRRALHQALRIGE